MSAKKRACRKVWYRQWSESGPPPGHNHNHVSGACVGLGL